MVQFGEAQETSKRVIRGALATKCAKGLEERRSWWPPACSHPAAAHAYGLAVDLNPFQNPYRNGDVVLPELASAYLDRAWRRPGMITPGGPAVPAFASFGWK